MSGVVHLVGAGPGDPKLITVAGLELLRTADVVVHDALAGTELLREARPDAELFDVGKRGGHHNASQEEINALLVAEARKGKRVVRLKGGDPFLFGRGGEEAEELRAAGIEVHVVPGVTSAIAAPALAGIPVTHRDHASAVTFITGHEAAGSEGVDWAALARLGGTLVILMGMSRLEENLAALVENGLDPGTPAAAVHHASTDEQRTVVATVSTLARRCATEGVGAPAVIVIGSVAALREALGDLR